MEPRDERERVVGENARGVGRPPAHYPDVLGGASRHLVSSMGGGIDFGGACDRGKGRASQKPRNGADAPRLCAPPRPQSASRDTRVCRICATPRRVLRVLRVLRENGERTLRTPRTLSTLCSEPARSDVLSSTMPPETRPEDLPLHD